MFMELISCDMAGALQNCCHLNTHSVNTHTIMLKLTLLFKATYPSGLMVHTGLFYCSKPHAHLVFWCTLGYLAVSMIHPTLKWTPGSLSLTCVCDLCACEYTRGDLGLQSPPKDLSSIRSKIWTCSLSIQNAMPSPVGQGTAKKVLQRN